MAAHATPAVGTGQAFDASAVVTYRFAPEWYRDAIREATQCADRHGRRREIVFAVCFAESYLHEWARELIGSDFRRFLTYLPPNDRRGLLDRWKELVAHLRRDGVIANVPTFNHESWQRFVTVVEWRNGLVHAGASRPKASGRPADELPVPTMDQLDTMKPGYCLNVVIDEIERLHAATTTPKPTWVTRVP